MGSNLPLQADQATAVKIHRRTELAIEGGLATAAFAHPSLAPIELKREAAWAALRWAHRALDEVAGIVEADEPVVVPMPPDEMEVDVDDFQAAEGTPVEDEEKP